MALISKTQRWLDLISYLAGRRVPVGVAELMERLPAYAAYENAASARRVFEHDKQEMRAGGIPIETVRYRVHYGHEEEEGYQLATSEFFLPELLLVPAADASARPTSAAPAAELPLTAEEAHDALCALVTVCRLAASPFTAAARSAYAKLALGMELDRAIDTREVSGSDVAAPAAAPHDPRILRLLGDALLARRRVCFRYHGARSGTESERTVAPYGLLLSGGHWYLVGHDEARHAIREFRVSRMEAAEVTRGGAAAYEIPADFRLRDYRGRQAWELGAEEGAVVPARARFRFPASLWVERNGVGEAVATESDGAVVRQFSVRSSEPFLRWLLSLAGNAEPIEPPELVAAYHALGRSVAALYPTPPEEEAVRG